MRRDNVKRLLVMFSQILPLIDDQGVLIIVHGFIKVLLGYCVLVFFLSTNDVWIWTGS